MNRGLFSSNTPEWSTPQDFFDALNAEFHFTLDPCCTHENAKCAKHYTKEQDGLAQDWTGEIVYCNPPYGREMPKWIKKCYEHFLNGGTAVMLIPARTDTKAFHEYIYGKAEIRFVKGRIRFSGMDQNAPFLSMVVVYKGGEVMKLIEAIPIDWMKQKSLDSNDPFNPYMRVLFAWFKEQREKK